MPRIKKWIDNKITLVKGVKRKEDVLSSISHAAGFILAAAGTVLLVLKSVSGRGITASLVYGISMAVVYAASATYHGLKKSTIKRIFRLIDHSSIYILIAATYTPYTMAMDPGIGHPMIITIWSAAVVGLILNFLFWDRFKVLHITIYLIMGWMVLLYWSSFTETFDPALIKWMFIGGFLYSGGIFFYINRKISFSHVIWHFFVLGGTLGLYIGIYKYVVPIIY